MQAELAQEIKSVVISALKEARQDAQWDVHDVAAFVRKEVSTVYKSYKKWGMPRPRKIGGSLVWDPKEVKAWYKNQPRV